MRYTDPGRSKKLLSLLLTFLLILHPILIVRAETPDIPEEFANQNPDLARAADLDREQYYDDSRNRAVGSLTPTPHPETVQVESSTTAPEAQSGESDGSSPTATPPPNASITNTGDNNATNQSNASNTNVTVANTNQATSDHQIDAAATTGDNTASNLINDVQTGDATADANVTTQVNTNMTGTEINGVVITEMDDHDGPINLSHIRPCQAYNKEPIAAPNVDIQNSGDKNETTITDETTKNTEVTNTNDADIVNDIVIAAKTGDNQSEGIINSIDTGDAVARADVFNMANTNLVGNCFFFGVITVFGNQTGDIILPYELGFVRSQSLNDSPPPIIVDNSGNDNRTHVSSDSKKTLEVNNDDNAEVSSNINALANTGQNTAEGRYSILETGTAAVKVNQLDRINTSIVGNNFLFLVVNTYGAWNGSIVGPPGQYAMQHSLLVLWYPTLPLYGALGPIPILAGTLPAFPGPLSITDSLAADTQPSTTITNSGDNNETEISSKTTESLTVNNTNNATVENYITALADTGNNTAEGRLNKIKTGDASVLVNIFNLINTNITGDNWFFGMVTVFGDFLGDVVFPRPDVAVSLSVHTPEVYRGDVVPLNLHFENLGHLWAEDVTLRAKLPAGLQITGLSNGGKSDGDTVEWIFGELAAQDGGDVTVLVMVDDDAPIGGTLTAQALVQTSTDEPNQENNTSQASLTVLERLSEDRPSTSDDTQTSESEDDGAAAFSSASTQGTLLASAAYDIRNRPLSRFYNGKHRDVLGVQTYRRLISINRFYCTTHPRTCVLLELLALGLVVGAIVKVRNRARRENLQTA